MEGSYSGAWRRYRVWSWVFWLAFLLYLPGVAYLSDALGWSRDGGNATLLTALVWMLVVAVVGYQKWNFACPRCGEMFFRKFDARPSRRDWQHNPFARRCMHCGLAKWAEVSG